MASAQLHRDLADALAEAQRTAKPIDPLTDARRIEAILRTKTRRLESVRRMIAERPSTVTEIADALVTTAILGFHRNLALSETLANIAYLRWSGLVERRVRPDGVYEWYTTGG